MAEVLAANGIEADVTQRRAHADGEYAIVDRRADAGVMITASHNPPRYNGLKLKAAYGGSAPACHGQGRGSEARRATGPAAAFEIEDAWRARNQALRSLPAYEAHVRRLVDFDVIRRGLRVAVDAMYGAGRIHLRRLLQDAGCDVTELRSEMNPSFNGIHPEPIARHLGPLIDAMRSGAYRLGLATDGDADRIGAVDPGGRFIDPHGIMALLLDYLVNDRGLRGSVVKTVSTTQILNRLAQRFDLPLHETPVGFNYISDWMLREQVLLGGEESGGISMLGHIPEGDGVLMALLLAEMVAARQKTLSQMLDELMDAPDIGRFHYARLDQPVRPFAKAELVEALLATAPAAIDGTPVHEVNGRDGVKYILQDGSWLLIRPSGTEPVLRIYAEARSDAQVQGLLEAGAQLAQMRISVPTAAS